MNKTRSFIIGLLVGGLLARGGTYYYEAYYASPNVEIPQPEITAEMCADVCPASGEVTAPEFTLPPMPTTSRDACQWEWKEGSDIGVWAEDCQMEAGRWTINHNSALPGFSVENDSGSGFVVVSTALQRFNKSAGDPISVLLPDLSLPEGATCEFVELTGDFAKAGATRYELVPTGATLDAYNAQQDQGMIPDDPCGPFGKKAEGMQFFEIQEGKAGTVVYFQIGQDGSYFDVNTVTVLK